MLVVNNTFSTLSGVDVQVTSEVILCVCYRRTVRSKTAQHVETPTTRRVSTQPLSGASPCFRLHLFVV